MVSLTTWVGVAIVAITLACDVWITSLRKVLWAREWAPIKPTPPPIGAPDDEPSIKNTANVIVVGYVTGTAFVIIGALDAAAVNPPCLPYSDFLSVYVVGFAGLAASFMWFTEGQNVTIPLHSGIRYTLASLVVLIPLYASACGQGVI